MSIKASYRRISPEKFSELQDNPKLAEEFFSEDPTTIALMERMTQARFQNNHELAQQLSVQAKEALYRSKASVYENNLDATKTRLSIEKSGKQSIIC